MQLRYDLGTAADHPWSRRANALLSRIMVRPASVVKQARWARKRARPCYNPRAAKRAGVAELVDAPDSKSGGARAPCRFEPDLRYRYVKGKVANTETIWSAFLPFHAPHPVTSTPLNI